MIERLRNRISTGASRAFIFCRLLSGVHSVPVLPHWPVEDSGHSAKSTGGRLRTRTYTLGRTKSPQWGVADAEITVPSVENTQLKRSPFKAWSRSVYSYTCYAYCQGFLPCLFYPSGPFTCIFSETSPDFSSLGCG